MRAITIFLLLNMMHLRLHKKKSQFQNIQRKNERDKSKEYKSCLEKIKCIFLRKLKHTVYKIFERNTTAKLK